jgi:hypothetical protein
MNRISKKRSVDNVIFNHASWYLLMFLFLLNSCSRKKHAELSTFNKEEMVVSGLYDLKGKVLQLQNTKLNVLEGGKLINGKIRCENCELHAQAYKIFENVLLEGNWSNNIGYLEWFLGGDFKDPKRNLIILERLLESDFQVVFNRLVPIEAASNVSTAAPTRSIFLKGTDRLNSGLVLITKHQNQFFNYFRSERGFNLHMENMSLLSEDYINGVFDERESQYKFTGAFYQGHFNPHARPSIDSIIIRNCFIGGNIGIAKYGAHSNNQSLKEFGENSMITKLIVENNTFQNCNSPFSFSNMGYGDIFVQNNEVFNFSAAFLSIPESGINEAYYEPLRINKGRVVFENNVFKNDRVVKVPEGRALSPCVIKGGNSSMFFNNNKLENLLSDSRDASVNTFYFTCQSPGFFSAKNNIIKNVVHQGSPSHPASMVRNRWCSSFHFENNQVSLEKEALVKIGVLKHINDDLKNIDGNKFYIELFQNGGQTSFENSFHIMNNQFSIPVINKSTEIHGMSDFVFKNNSLKIDYFGPSNVTSTTSRDNVLFLSRHRYDRDEKREAKGFIFSKNKITIDKTDGHLIFLEYPNGVQVNGKNGVDKNFNFKLVELRDTIFVNNTTITVGVPDGEIQNFSPVIAGKNNSFEFIDHSNANHMRSNARKFGSNIFIENAEWNNRRSPFVFIPDSKQSLIVKNHSGDIIPIFNYIYFISLYNLVSDENLLCQISIIANDKNNQTLILEYYVTLNQRSRSFLFENTAGSFVEIDPSNARGDRGQINTFNSSTMQRQNTPKLILERGDRHLKESRIYFENCKDIKNYQVDVSIRRIGHSRKNQQETKRLIEELISKK